MSADAATAAGETVRAVPAGGDDLDRRYGADSWQACELGVAAARGRGAVSFERIDAPWLRGAVKSWARQRLAAGCAFNTICAGALAFKRFSSFLACCRPPVTDPQDIDRALLERYLAWLRPLPLAEGTKALSRVFLRAFLEENRRYRWLPTIAAEATIYPEELSSRRHTLPRFIPELVMGQLESKENLAQLRMPYRSLVVLIAETGRRAGDACALPFDPLLADSTAWPCLRFASSKVRAEHLLPLSTAAVEAVRAAQHHVQEICPQGSAWLFPSRSDHQLPVPYESFRKAFVEWQHPIGLNEENGCVTSVTIHRFRHTLGTRLINSGVAKYVIQRLLGHASPMMTAAYAHMHDSTIRAEFERYCLTGIDVEGCLLGFDPQAFTADAEWVKHRLSRAADTLPNGYCGRPPRLPTPQRLPDVPGLPNHRRVPARPPTAGRAHPGTLRRRPQRQPATTGRQPPQKS